MWMAFEECVYSYLGFQVKEYYRMHATELWWDRFDTVEDLVWNSEVQF